MAASTKTTNLKSIKKPNMPTNDKLNFHPSIVHFKTKNNHYIYDAPTNEILSVSSVFWAKSKDSDFWNDVYNKLSSKNAILKNRNSTINEAIKAIDGGLFSRKKPKTLSLLISEEEYFEALETRLEHLVLGVTEKCNCRCEYCTYSGKYDYQRKHSNVSMDLETAKSAVSFFLSRNKKSEKCNIGFYGGEPTLNMRVVKEVVKQAKNYRKDVFFNMTSNGCNINDKDLEFIVENKMALLLSLDGPQNVHNKFRKNKDGLGTFDNVYKTLCRIRKIDHNYFSNLVQISCVIGPPYNVRELTEFFNTDPILKEVSGFRISTISMESGSFFQTSATKNASSINVPESDKFNALKEEYKKNVINNEPYSNKFQASLFEESFVRLHKRDLFSEYSDSIFLNGMCIPGIRRIFVSPAGIIKVCEKVNETIEIGNISTGFDKHALKYLIENYIKKSNQNCLTCYANRLCYACFSTDYSKHGFNPDLKQASCIRIRDRLIENLQDYCEVLEKNPSSLDFIKDITVS